MVLVIPTVIIFYRLLVKPLLLRAGWLRYKRFIYCEQVRMAKLFGSEIGFYYIEKHLAREGLPKTFKEYCGF